MTGYVGADPEALRRLADEVDRGAADIERVRARLTSEAAEAARLLQQVAGWARGAAHEQRRAIEAIRRFNEVTTTPVGDRLRLAGESLKRAASAVWEFLRSPERLLRGHRPGTFYASDPVNTATGNFVHSESDLPFPSAASRLSLVRTYNSTDAEQGEFGVGWSTSHTMRLRHGADGVDVHDRDGRVVTFVRDGDGYRPPPGVHATLVVAPNEPARLAWFCGETWEFDAAGRLAAVHDPEGMTLTYRYREGRLTRIQHSTGRFLTVSHDADGRISRLESNDGRAAEYRYEDAALASVTGPGGVTTRYETDDRGLITEIRDADGYLVIANEYDRHRRVVAQTGPGGNRTTFDYSGTGQTTVTDTVTGTSTVFQHDDRGMLVRLVDAHGHTVLREHDDAGNVLLETNRRGYVRSQQFNEQGLLVERVGFAGGREQFTYDEQGRVTTAVDPLGAVTQYAYSGGSRIPRSINSPSGATTLVSSQLGQLDRLRDPDGVISRLLYDGSGNLTEVREAGVPPVRLSTDAAGRLTRSAGALGESVIEYDEAGHPRRIRDGVGAEATIVFTPGGRPLSSRDARGAERSVRYDDAGRVAKSEEPGGRLLRYHYGADGELARIEHPDGTDEFWERDALGRLVASTEASGARTTYAYDADGNLQSVAEPGGAVWHNEYDAEGRVVATVDPTGFRSETTYDLAGRAVEVIDAAAGSTRIGYDEDGRPATVELPEGDTLELSYTPAGRPARQRVGDREAEIVYDDRGRPVATIGPDGQRTRLGYDGLGRVDSSTSPGGLVHRFAFDGGGRPTACTRPDGSTWRMAWSPGGDLTSLEEPTGAVRRFEYDVLGQLVASVDANGGTATLGYDWRGMLVEARDQLGGRRLFERDAGGRVVADVDPLGRITRHRYDSAGRLERTLDPSGRSLTATWDGAGRLLALESGLGNRVEYSYDGAGRPVAVTASGSSTRYERHSDGQLFVIQDGDPTLRFARTLHGAERERLRVGVTERPVSSGTEQISVLIPEGSQLRRRLDHDGYLSEESVEGHLLREWHYERSQLVSYDESVEDQPDHVKVERDSTGRITRCTTRSSDVHYGYDAAGQLIEVAESGSSIRYTYDAAGRRTRVEHSDGHTELYDFDAAGQCTAMEHSQQGRREIEYDAAGRRVRETARDEQVEYTYDDFGLLTDVFRTSTQGDTRERREYDAEGRLRRIVLDGFSGRSDSRLEWDSTGELPELCAVETNGARIDYWGDPLRPLVRSSGQQLEGIPQDAFGSHLDGRHRFDAFGQPEPPYPLDYVGRGYRGSLHVGPLLHLTHRDYDPRTGQFLSPDPLPGGLGTPSLWAPYAYAANDPVNLIDPLGLSPIGDAAIRGGATGGGSVPGGIGAPRSASAVLTPPLPEPLPHLPTGPPAIPPPAGLGDWIKERWSKLAGWVQRRVRGLLGLAERIARRALAVGRAALRVTRSLAATAVDWLGDRIQDAKEFIRSHAEGFRLFADVLRWVGVGVAAVGAVIFVASWWTGVGAGVGALLFSAGLGIVSAGDTVDRLVDWSEGKISGQELLVGAVTDLVLSITGTKLLKYAWKLGGYLVREAMRRLNDIWPKDLLRRVWEGGLCRVNRVLAMSADPGGRRTSTSGNSCLPGGASDKHPPSVPPSREEAIANRLRGGHAELDELTGRYGPRTKDVLFGFLTANPRNKQAVESAKRALGDAHAAGLMDEVADLLDTGRLSNPDGLRVLLGRIRKGNRQHIAEIEEALRRAQAQTTADGKVQLGAVNGVGGDVVDFERESVVQVKLTGGTRQTVADHLLYVGEQLSGVRGEVPPRTADGKVFRRIALIQIEPGSQMSGATREEIQSFVDDLLGRRLENPDLPAGSTLSDHVDEVQVRNDRGLSKIRISRR